MNGKRRISILGVTGSIGASTVSVIESLGADTPRGELVRTMGLPDRREQRQGVESFWYDDAGTVYRFRDGVFLGEERQGAKAVSPPPPDPEG